MSTIRRYDPTSMESFVTREEYARIVDRAEFRYGKGTIEAARYVRRTLNQLEEELERQKQKEQQDQLEQEEARAQPDRQLPELDTPAPLCTWVNLGHFVPHDQPATNIFGEGYDTGGGVIVNMGDLSAPAMFLPNHRLVVCSHRRNRDSGGAVPLYAVRGASESVTELERLREALEVERFYSERQVLKSAEEANKLRHNFDRAKAELDSANRQLVARIRSIQAQLEAAIDAKTQLAAENKRLRAELARGGVSPAEGEFGSLSEADNAEGQVSVIESKPTSTGLGALTKRLFGTRD